MASLATSSDEGKLKAVYESLSNNGADPQAALFAKALFSSVDSQEFAAYTAVELAGFAADAYAHLASWRGGKPALAIRDVHTKQGSLTIVDIVNDDMPFLVDSVLAELRAIGLTPEFVAHPVLAVERDAAGELHNLRVNGGGMNGARRESFIHLHLRRAGEPAGHQAIAAGLEKVLENVRVAVTDFAAMIERLNKAIAALKSNPPPVSMDVTSEAVHFLKWLLASNFIFLGVREYRYEGDASTGELTPGEGTGLGLLRNPDMPVLRRGAVERRLTDASRSFFLNSPPVIVAKANSKSDVHRRVRMDTIGVKLYGPDGAITGEMRVAGLFTVSAYSMSTRNIPLLRMKVDEVLRLSNHAPDSYSGRALLNVLETFPRDELFQIGTGQLAQITDEILKLDLSPRPRVFVRRDEFGRFLSCFVYVPRERFSTDVRQRVAAMLEQAFGGVFESFTPFFTEGTMVRLHIVIWRGDEELREAHEADLEWKVEAIIRTWRDAFRDRLLQHYGSNAGRLITKYLDAFPAGYEETNRPGRGVEDIQRLEKLRPEAPAEIDLYQDGDAPSNNLRATLLQLDEPIALSRRVPILENFGFNVISERTFRIEPKGNENQHVIYLHDSEIETAGGTAIAIYEHEDKLEAGFLAVWREHAANDRFNGLIVNAGLDWREAAIIRAYAAYLRQTGAPYGQAYLAQVLNKHGGVSASLMTLFHTLFDPGLNLSPDERERRREALTSAITGKLEAIPLLDEDRILRRFLAMIEATLRTNFYQRNDNGFHHNAIAFKLRSRAIDWLPAPKPFAEIFVTSTRFEGIHLRGGPVARGGLRWSDRPQDFRTEILSLAKAQQVKNTVIIPQGAKGGFVPRKELNGAPRDVVLAEGIACYKDFVSSLLSITDNLVQGEIVPPENTVRRDGDDPYLVVAADKGTATFSDIANGISVGRGFWLGDAFASGGSAGYDHKKMGITARGAWEAVKRHFREMDIDIQTQPFTVAGVGDMSGDVFGNGMLLSRTIKLVAAFDHRDIFIDPDPDPEVSFAERERLFGLSRSSWQDYDHAKLSPGGGVYSRGSKYILLSPEARALLGLSGQATPQDIMTAILKAEVDLMWFGGIGTFVRASAETDAQAGDRANDAIRVPAAALRAKAVGEGANLALTQKARIEYAMQGGRLNTDAIDNSAGVNSSDYEVNIKIALGEAVVSGKLSIEDRNVILAGMTEDVANAVLRNNYRQTLAISLGEERGLSDLGFQQLLMRKLEEDGPLDRSLENLPSDAALIERRAAGRPLTRPELAVLLAYAKIDLNADLAGSAVPDDPYLGRELFDYFPAAMRDRFAEEIAAHPLRREIIATALTNDIINYGGSTFAVRLIEETGHSPVQIAYAFAAAKAVYSLDDLYARVDALDATVKGAAQLGLYREVQDLLRRQTAWFLRHGDFREGLEPEIARYRQGVDYLALHMKDVLPEKAAADLIEQERALQSEGLPENLGVRLAALAPLAQALDIVIVADQTSQPVDKTAQTLFEVRDAFHLHDLSEASENLGAADYFDRLAVNSTLAAVAGAQRALVRAVLTPGNPYETFEAWRAAHDDAANRVSRSIAEIIESGSFTLAKLTVAVAQLRDLARI